MVSLRMPSSAVVTLVLMLVVSGFALAQEQRVISVVLQDFHEQGPRHVIETILVPEFERLNPGVKVDVTWIPWGDYIEAYVTRHVAGILPDVVSIGASGLGQFVEQGLIRSIDPYMREWEALSDFVPAAHEDSMINGEFYAVPYRLDVRTLAYNRTYFDESGLNRDAPPRTWEELEDYAIRLARHDAEGNLVREGFDVRADIQHVLPFVFQSGAEYMSADGKEVLLASDEGIEAISFLHKLIYERNVSNPAAWSFVRGDTAMVYDGTWLMQDAWAHVDTGIAEPLRHREQSTHVHINRFGISSTSRHPDLAWEWIKFMMEPTNLQRVILESRAFPPVLPVLQMEPYNQDPRWNQWLTAAMVARPVPGFVPELAEVVGKYNAALREILNNQAPAASRLEAMAEEVNTAVLKRDN